MIIRGLAGGLPGHPPAPGPWVERAESVGPGHGSPQTRDGALGLLEADLAYLTRLGAAARS